MLFIGFLVTFFTYNIEMIFILKWTKNEIEVDFWMTKDASKKKYICMTA